VNNNDRQTRELTILKHALNQRNVPTILSSLELALRIQVIGPLFIVPFAVRSDFRALPLDIL
jgi:hypothetical protein